MSKRCQKDVFRVKRFKKSLNDLFGQSDVLNTSRSMTHIVLGTPKSSNYALRSYSTTELLYGVRYVLVSKLLM